ncbi:MAG: type I-D CRISPR-associated endonuclease Cas1d [Chloroflexi bacterium]|nr:type I-D CRISPR-associated endonuclease Cas1d [Chloroflexota bacterium]
MPTVYLTEQRALVRLSGECLQVQIPEDRETGRERRSVEIPLIKIDDVVVLGEVTVTASAIGALMERGITLCFLGGHGQYRGTLVPEPSRHGQLRIAQHAAYLDDGRRVVLARQFVAGKLSNMRTILLRQNRSLGSDELAAAAESIRHCGESAEEVVGVASLLGLEGAASAAYFRVFGSLLRQPLGFSKRLRRPPPDPINALLSFGYSLLTQKVIAAAQAAGLDPFVGYLHSPQYGRPSVALDLMEEFRPIITDSVVITAINRGVLKPDNFASELGSCRLDDRGRRLFLEQFEARLEQEIEHPVFGYRATYRRCLELQARLLGKALIGDIPAYVPFKVR